MRHFESQKTQRVNHRPFITGYIICPRSPHTQTKTILWPHTFLAVIDIRTIFRQPLRPLPMTLTASKLVVFWLSNYRPNMICFPKSRYSKLESFLSKMFSTRFARGKFYPPPKSQPCNNLWGHMPTIERCSILNSVWNKYMSFRAPKHFRSRGFKHQIKLHDVNKRPNSYVLVWDRKIENTWRRSTTLLREMRHFISHTQLPKVVLYKKTIHEEISGVEFRKCLRKWEK